MLEGCVCEIQPSCSAGNNGREASVEMQIRERVADSLIHVRGLWFRATRTAAYTRGIKEFVLEFCTRQAKGQRALYNVTQCTLPIPGDCLTCAYRAWRIVVRTPPPPSLAPDIQRDSRLSSFRPIRQQRGFLEMTVDRRFSSLCTRVYTRTLGSFLGFDGNPPFASGPHST